MANFHVSIDQIENITLLSEDLNLKQPNKATKAVKEGFSIYFIDEVGL